MPKRETLNREVMVSPAGKKLGQSHVHVQSLPQDSTTLANSGIKEEQQLNVWIPKDLMKRLKVKGAETDRSMKEIVIKALEQFL